MCALLCLALLALSACTSPRHETATHEVLAEMQTTLDAAAAGSTATTTEQPPEDVLQALVPGLTLNSDALQPVEERFDFAVQEPMDAREFFSLLTEGTDYSIAIHPGVSGTISTLDLKNVTIQEALDQVSTLYGYTITRDGNIFQVMPGGLETRIFNVNYLNVSRSGSSTMSVTSGGLSSGGNNNGSNNNDNGNNNNGNNNNGSNNNNGNNNNGNNNNNDGNNNGNNNNGGGGGGSGGGANISTSTESDYWRDLEKIIAAIIGTSVAEEGSAPGLLSGLTANAGAAAGRMVIISPQTGMVMVRAYPNELDRVAEFLAQSQNALQRQVVLEAKILEVTLNEQFQSGIDLQLIQQINSDDRLGIRSSFLNEQSQTDGATGSPVPVPIGGIAQALQLAYDATDFDGVIRLLETQGSVEVISNPRITTLNNQKAVFKVGDEEYFSTDQNTTTTTGGNSTVQNSNVSLQPFFSGIALDVTPQISENGDIILHIHPLLNSVEQDEKLIGGDLLALPKSDTRESDSIARARNGEVIIISGLMQTRARGTEAGIPGARDVPVIGNAFERTMRETEKTELVILLRAVVDENGSMQELIQDHSDNLEAMRQLIDPYYRGQ